MANFSAAFADEADKSNADYRLSVKFTFPDGIKRYSDVALHSRLDGYHEPWVLDWGEISDAAGDRSNATQVSDWVSLRIADPEGDWIRRGHSYELRGTPVQLVYGVVDLDPADWFTRSFILLDWKAADGVITIQCGPSFLLQLLAPFPEIRMTLQDFPDMPDEFVDVYAPIGPYGRIDGWSFGKANKGSSDGAIAPIYVGEYTETNLLNVEVTGSKYIIGVGQIKSVLTVFRNGTPITAGFATGNWQDQAIYEEINGVMWSRIMFDDNVSDDPIAVDVEGYETVGDGTGDLITGMADQVEHFLTNFGFGRYKHGLWLSSSSNLSATYLTAVKAYLATRIPNDYVGGRYIEATTDRGLVMDEIDAWCGSAEVKPLFTVSGQLGFGGDSFDDPGDVDLLPWLRTDDEIDTGPLTPTYPSTDAAKRIIGESGYSQARGDYGERLMIVSPTAQEDAADKVTRQWGPHVLATDYPMDVEGEYWWIKPQNLRDLEDGEPVTLYQDEGNSRKDLFQLVAANAPTYKLDAINGFPGLEFNGVDQWLDGPDGSDIMHIAAGSQMFGLFITDITTEQTIYQAGSSCRLWIEAGKIKASNNGDSVQTDITLGWHVVARQHFGNLIRIRVDNPVSGTFTASGNNSGFGLVTVGAGASGVNPFAGIIVEIANHRFGQQQQSFAKLFAHFMRNVMPRGDTPEQERDASSRRGVGNERSRMFLTMTTPLWPLNYDLLQPFAMSHPEIPHPGEDLDRWGYPTGKGGAGKDKWARRLLNLMERVEDVGQHTMSLGLADRTGVSHLARYSGIGEFTHISRREGVAASGLGVRRIFSHVVPLYVKSPAGFVEQVLPGLNYGLAEGELQDASAKPLLLRTSFQSGFSGLTATAGSGSVVAVNILDDGAPRLFGLMRDPQASGVSGVAPITEQLARFTAGNPHASDTKLAWPVSVDHVVDILSSSVQAGPSTTILTQLQHGLRDGDEITIAGHTGATPDINGTHTVTVTGTHTFSIAVDVTVAGTGGTLTRLLQAGDAVCLSVDIRGIGGPLHFEAVNEDGDFWDNALKVFDAAPALNPFPLGDADDITRVRSEPIVYAGTSGQLAVTLLFPAGEVVVDGVVDVYHVQLEDNPFPSSRMPQDDTYIGERPAPALTWFESDSKGTYAFNEPCFTVAMRLTPPWDELDLQAYAGGDGIDLYFWKACYEHPPDNNFWAGGFDGSQGQAKWFLMMRNDTNEDTAIQDTDMPVRGTEVAVVWRLVGANGDWDYPPHTMIVSVNGVHGAPFTLENTRPVPIPNARIELGLWSAFAKDIRFDWRVWSDEEVTAWSV